MTQRLLERFDSEWAVLSERPSFEPRGARSMVVPAGEKLDGPEAATQSFSDGLADALVALGVEHVFGVFGGGIAPFCEAVSRKPMRLMHCRNEAGAAFAAIEASLATGKLTVVVATTGPGATSLYTGMVAARWEGARVLFVSGSTRAAQRGRWAFQETTSTSMSSLFVPGAVFHYASMLENPAELETLVSRLATGISRPNGFVAHVGLPLELQTARVSKPARPRVLSTTPPVCDASTAELCAELLSVEPFVIWAGFGARRAAPLVRALAERARARVMCSPRAKGIIPETSPLFLGVTGLGGHAKVETYLEKARPKRALVLGSRLGEFTSFWSRGLVPEQGFIHVDIDSDVFGAAYPDVPTLGVQSDIGSFLEAILDRWPERRSSVPIAPVPSVLPPQPPRASGPVRSSFLMHAIQDEIVENSAAIVLAEAGNAFSLCSHYLQFDEPARYRVSTGFGSMGQAAGGVLGAAVGRRGKAVAVLGDGAMLMLNELNTAAAYDIDAVWIVLNDARYGMVEQGMRSIGWTPFETSFPRSDFVAIARAMGADGVCVEREADLAEALRKAMSARGPFVVDVLVDETELAPSNKRNKSLVEQGVNGESR